MGGLGVLLLAVGAILAFAVNYEAEGVNLSTIGVILMVAGAVGVLAALVQGRFMTFRTTTERHVSSDGRHVVESESTGAI